MLLLATPEYMTDTFDYLKEHCYDVTASYHRRSTFCFQCVQKLEQRYEALAGLN